MTSGEEYQSPVLFTIGSVVELTQVDKDLGNADGGITFQGQTTTVP